jgi:murein L,D-transpeptidase YafK
MKRIIILLLLLLPILAYGGEKADAVLVIKSRAKMFLLKNGKNIKEYHVVFGANPKGHKQKEGDERTPEGKYVIDFKNNKSAFYKSMHISYPNEKDKSWAKKNKVNPGGAIMIHGQKNGFGGLSWISQRFNWTNGCIAVTNKEMDEIWQMVDVGTPIEIKP